MTTLLIFALPIFLILAYSFYKDQDEGGPMFIIFGLLTLYDVVLIIKHMNIDFTLFIGGLVLVGIVIFVIRGLRLTEVTEEAE
ncbi:hypothetical protein BSK59_13260 [Paenibacillus odorifer]|uniref:hypothetical protein n=1 Tax=Paenibacillus odorifer TaxID=189426 RepID=UPI00096F49B8|nr:hypothetical protein [Paenibacillus odorifer]OME55440.1 hypothetical protein BSK59_13260 [Paenibacillus odorifer]